MPAIPVFQDLFFQKKLISKAHQYFKTSFDHQGISTSNSDFQELLFPQNIQFFNNKTYHVDIEEIIMGAYTAAAPSLL